MYFHRLGPDNLVNSRTYQYFTDIRSIQQL